MPHDSPRPPKRCCTIISGPGSYQSGYTLSTTSREGTNRTPSLRNTSSFDLVGSLMATTPPTGCSPTGQAHVTSPTAPTYISSPTRIRSCRDACSTRSVRPAHIKKAVTEHRRTRSCWFSGSFDARIEMKITLSTPSTTSRVSSAASALHAAGSLNQFMVAPWNAGDTSRRRSWRSLLLSQFM